MVSLGFVEAVMVGLLFSGVIHIFEQAYLSNKEAVRNISSHFREYMPYRQVKADRIIQKRITVVATLLYLISWVFINDGFFSWMLILSFIYIVLLVIIVGGNPVLTKNAARTLVASKFALIVFAYTNIVSGLF